MKWHIYRSPLAKPLVWWVRTPEGKYLPYNTFAQCQEMVKCAIRLKVDYVPFGA